MESLTAAQIGALRLRLDTPPAENELPAALEYPGLHGSCHLFLYLLPAQPDALMPDLHAVKIQKSEAGWQVICYPVEGERVTYSLADDQAQALLDANGLQLYRLTESSTEG